MASLSSGVVIVTVTAFSLPIKPQTYALAVQVRDFGVRNIVQPRI